MSYPIGFSLSLMIGTAPVCCDNSCAPLVPFVANGSYHDPDGGGEAEVFFRVSGSPFCGISVAGVLRGELGGLEARDDLVELNPRAKSMRLRIEVSNFFSRQRVP